MEYSIYYLRCPISNQVKYVGMTKDIVKRLWQHTRKETSNKMKDAWILTLKLNGLKPVIEIVEDKLTKECAEEREKFYISINAELFNVLPGGLNPPSNKGNRLSEEKKRLRFIESPLKKKVIQRDKTGTFIKEYEGVREAWRITGIDHRSISQVAGGSTTRKSAGGFIWEYIK